jgi:type II secretory pathway predicted ATPase ExeA
MYRKHFVLTRLPFSNGIDTDVLFPSNALRELEVRLGHLLELRGIGIVTRESGSGKTTASRKVVAGLHTGLYRVLYVCLTTGNVMDMYKTIARELGLPIERNRAALFRRIVVRAHVTGLSRDEIGPYLTHRLGFAGTELQLFEAAAQEALFQASSGLPRKLNLLCHHALMAAASRGPRALPPNTSRPLPEVT